MMRIVLVLCGLALVSCKKNYTCQCETHVYGQDPLITHTVIKDTKSNAKVECDAIKTNSQAASPSYYVECGIQ